MAMNTDIHLHAEHTVEVRTIEHHENLVTLSLEVRENGSRQGTVTLYCHTAEQKALARAIGAIASLATV
jgi:hypothetical protein